MGQRNAKFKVRENYMRKQTKRLSYNDRKKIEDMLFRGFSKTRIAEEMGISRFILYYELNRCCRGEYTADQAQKTIGIPRKELLKKINKTEG